MPSWENLQPLRIPGGWVVSYNNLSDFEPEGLPEDDNGWLGFTEDILQLHSVRSRTRNGQKEEQTLILDLGWYPDSDPAGSFRLQAVLNCDWEFPLLQFSSRSKAEVVERLEKWLFQVFMPPYFIEEEIFRRNHPAGQPK